MRGGAGFGAGGGGGRGRPGLGWAGATSPGPGRLVGWGRGRLGAPGLHLSAGAPSACAPPAQVSVPIGSVPLRDRGS